MSTPVIDPQSLGGNAPDGRKVKGTLHWLSAAHAVRAEVRLYDRLFTAEDPMDVPEGKDWRDVLNPHSMDVLGDARIEPALAEAAPGRRFQFERMGYFCVDPDARPGAPVFNRTVGLKDCILNLLPATLLEMMPVTTPGHLLVKLQVGQQPLLARITQRSAHTLKLQPAMPLWVQIKAVALLE